MEKKKKIISVTVVVLLVAVLAGGVGLYQTKEKNSKDCRFLQTYGSINYVPGGDNECSLAFVTKGWTNNLAEGDLKFQVESKNVDVTYLRVSQSVKSGSYALWDLYFKFDVADFEPGDADICISDVTLNGKKLSIGELYLHAVKQRGSTEELKSLGSSASTSGTKFSDFIAIMQNQMEDACNITEVSAPYYSDLLVGFADGEGVLAENLAPFEEAVALEPNKSYTMTISFEQAKMPEAAQLFYASPILTYEKDGKSEEMAFDSLRCGVDLSKDDLKQYGEALFGQ